MADIELQHTTVIETSSDVRVQLLFADDSDSSEASQKIQIDLLVKMPEGRPLLEYRAAALFDARRVIDEKISQIERLRAGAS